MFAVPVGNIEPAPFAAGFHRRIQFQIVCFCFIRPNFPVDAQHRTQGNKSLWQKSTQTILFHAVCHDKLFHFHMITSVFSQMAPKEALPSTKYTPDKRHK